MTSFAKAALSLIVPLAAAAGCATGHPPSRPPSPPAEVVVGPTPRVAPASAPEVSPRSAAAPAPLPAPGAGASTGRAKLRPAALLVGTWRPTDAPPGAVGPALARPGFGDEIGLEFRADGTWTIAGASYRSGGTYRWVGADEIEMAIVESNLASQVGSVSRKRVSVDATELALTVERQDGKGQPGGLAVVTRFRRTGK